MIMRACATRITSQRKADQNEAELAQAMRRERSGQGAIADAQAEVEDLKGELSRMQEVFARCCVLRGEIFRLGASCVPSLNNSEQRCLAR